MAKPNLLEYVQGILSDMDADEVSSIADTIEAQQVAHVVRSIYRQVVEEYDLQGNEIGFQLEASGTTTRPTHMMVPTTIFDVAHVAYDVRNSASDAPAFTTIPYATNEEFLQRVSNNDLTAAEYDTVTDPTTGFVFGIRNNRAPSMWTSLDGGETLIFDSYNSAVDSTLQTSKTQCLGRKRLDISITDTAELSLPENLSQLVYNEAREVCFELFKDGAPRVVNERARFSRMKAKERQAKISKPRHMTLPDYGRK